MIPGATNVNGRDVYKQSLVMQAVDTTDFHLLQTMYSCCTQNSALQLAH